MKKIFLAVLFLWSATNAFAAGIAFLPTPDGFERVKSTPEGVKFINRDTDVILLVFNNGEYKGNFQEELKQERFAKNIVEGLERTSYKTISSFRVEEIQGQKVLVLEGKYAEGKVYLNKGVLCVKNGIFYTIDIFAPTPELLDNSTYLFAEIIKQL